MSDSTASTSTGQVDSNILVMLCKQFKFADCIPYFVENQFDSVNYFLECDNAILDFTVTCPSAFRFVNILRSYQSKCETSVKSGGSNKQQSLSHLLSESTSEYNYDNFSVSPQSQSPLQNVSISLPTDDVYRINTNCQFPFIQNDRFTISGFKFPSMPSSFEEINDPEASDHTLSSCLATKVFQEVARVIWLTIKPAYPNNVPPMVIHEICCAFTLVFEDAQRNFTKMRELFQKSNFSEEFVDIGKFLKPKLLNMKRTSAASSKKEGKWSFTKGRERFFQANQSRINRQIETNRLPVKQQMVQLQTQFAELKETMTQQWTLNQISTKQKEPVFSLAQQSTDENVPNNESTVIGDDEEERQRLEILQQRSMIDQTAIKPPRRSDRKKKPKNC